jgi:hypothetical protein
MIFQNAVNAGSFIYCMIYQSPNEIGTYFNDNNGHYHASLYVVDGTADVWLSDTDTPTDNDKIESLEPGMFYDTSHTKGKYVTSKTGSTGVSTVNFNPIPANRLLNVEILKGSQTIEINYKTTIVCITGPINVNGKELKSTQYAKVFTNNTATLTMEENTICALVTE